MMKRHLLSSLRESFLSPRRLFAASAILSLLLVSFHLAVLGLTAEERARGDINDILAALSSLAATLGLAYGAFWSRRLDRRLGLAWGCFAAGMLGWAIGDLLWLHATLSQREIPAASLADAFYLSTYPLFLLGLYLLPRAKAETSPWTWVDIAIVVFAAVGIYWNFVLAPWLTQLAPANRLAIWITIAYPLGDILLIGGITAALLLPGFSIWLPSLSFLLIGQGLAAIADSLFSYYTLRGDFSRADSFNILFSMAPLVLMLGGVAQARLVSRRLSGETIPLPPEQPLTILRLVTPFVWLVFAYLLLLFGPRLAPGLPCHQNWLWLSALLGTVAVRQVAAALQNRRLERALRDWAETLEKRVAERSAELLRVNEALRQQMEEQRRIQALLREREERLAYSATHDSLTGLPNRTLLVDRLTQTMRRYRRHPDQRYALLFLDLDNFKTVNDSLGHLAGDELLIQVGKRLRDLVRAEDTVARISGDEFILLLEQCQNREQALCVAQRVLEGLKPPFEVDGHVLYINASIGIVLAEAEHNDPMELLRDADLAMYEAKAGGKGRFVLFSSPLRERAMHRLTLDTDLRQAFQSDAFVLYYQPIVALQSGKIVGFEALLRWQHPTRGLIGPAEFIPIAEANGFIHTITEWTLQEACRQIQAWNALQPDTPLFVSVNLSPVSLHRPELLQWVDNSLRSTSLLPNCLRLEIVETALLQDRRAEQALEQMRQRGIEIGLDDFGTGYSSLSSIHRYPIDLLKIDRSFVSRLTQNAKLDSIVRAIVHLAQELGLQAIAEGIETRPQYDFVKSIGCPLGQGFFLSPPLEARQAQDLLARGGVIPIPSD